MKQTIEVIREDPEDVVGQFHGLVSEGEGVFEHILELLHCAVEGISHCQANTVEHRKLNRATMLLTARFYSAAQAGLLLLGSGLVLQAQFMSRDMVETLVVLRYLQAHPKEVDNWTKATTRKQRMEFRVSRLCKAIPNGRTYKQQFDMLSVYLHTTSLATGGILRPAPANERLYLGGFYQPFPVANELSSQMALSIELLHLLARWYGKNDSWTLDTNEVKLMAQASLQYWVKLRDSASKEDLKFEDTVSLLKHLPIAQIEAWWERINR